MGSAMGVFSSPNLAGIMNSLPPDQRGAGAGMTNTFQNSSQVLSIGVFFSLIILGLAHSSRTPSTAGWSPRACQRRGPTGGLAAPGASLFAAFLGYNPIRDPARPVAQPPPPGPGQLSHRPQLLPHLISAPFDSGLSEAFTFAVVACLVAAAASWLRGGQYHHGQESAPPAGGKSTAEDAEGEALPAPGSGERRVGVGSGSPDRILSGAGS